MRKKPSNRLRQPDYAETLEPRCLLSGTTAVVAETDSAPDTEAIAETNSNLPQPSELVGEAVTHGEPEAGVETSPAELAAPEDTQAHTPNLVTTEATETDDAPKFTSDQVDTDTSESVVTDPVEPSAATASEAETLEPAPIYPSLDEGTAPESDSKNVAPAAPTTPSKGDQEGITSIEDRVAGAVKTAEQEVASTSSNVDQQLELTKALFGDSVPDQDSEEFQNAYEAIGQALREPGPTFKVSDEQDFALPTEVEALPSGVEEVSELASRDQLDDQAIGLDDTHKLEDAIDEPNEITGPETIEETAVSNELIESGNEAARKDNSEVWRVSSNVAIKTEPVTLPSDANDTDLATNEATADDNAINVPSNGAVDFVEGEIFVVFDSAGDHDDEYSAYDLTDETTSELSFASSTGQVEEAIVLATPLDEDNEDNATVEEATVSKVSDDDTLSEPYAVSTLNLDAFFDSDASLEEEYVLPTNVSAGYDAESQTALINRNFAQRSTDEELTQAIREETGEHLAAWVSRETGLTFEGDVGERLGLVLAGMTAADATAAEKPGTVETEAIVDGKLTIVRAMTGSSLQINASGDEGGEQFRLIIAGETVGTYTVDQQLQNYSYQAANTVVADDVRVEFFGDQYEPENNIDKNLNVDYVQLDGRLYQTDDESVFSTGTWVEPDGIVPGFGRGETLHSNGYFQYSDSSPTGNEILIRASGDEGTEQFDLELAGQNVATYQVTTEFQDYLYRPTNVVSVDDVRIAFTNDRYEPENNVDANLNVDYIEVSGTRYETESPIVFAEGVWVEPAGISAGFGLGETLHSNGSFQYAGTLSESGVFSLDGSVFTVSEQGGVAEIRVNRTQGATGPATIDYQTLEGTAIDGEDFVAQNGTLVFQDGETFQLVSIPITDDNLDEPSEQFSFAIDNPVGAGLLAPRTATVTIQDEDSPPPPPPPPPPTQLETETVVTGLIQPTSLDFSPDGRNLYVAEQRGIIKVQRDGLDAGVAADLTDRVNGTRDRGLLDIAIHPEFETNPYLYTLYTYDPPEVYENPSDPLAGPDKNGNRAGRLTRWTLDEATDYTRIVPNSEVVLVGKNSTWENFNGFANSTNNFNEAPAGILPDGTNLQDFIATDSESHTVGSVEFAPDGALIVSIGDGTSYNRVDPRTVRVQDIDNLSGKILRIDAITGEGLSDNPFFNGDADSNRSKVYQSGLRNPFRTTVDSATGEIYIGDVGWTKWEEINSGPAGANFGWPYYEGGDTGNLQTGGYKDLPSAANFYANEGNSVTAPNTALSHSRDGINAIVLGDVYNGTEFPEEYQGDLFFNDLGQGIVRHADLDAEGNIVSVDTFTTGARIVVQIVQGPDGNMYFVDLDDGQVGRWKFV